MPSRPHRTPLASMVAITVVVISAGCVGYTSDITTQSCLGTGQEVIQNKCLLCHNATAAAQGVVPAGAVY